MTAFLIGMASNWAGARVACRFKAWADGVQLSAKDDTAPFYVIPDGTVEVKLTATPQASASTYWENTIVLAVTPTALTAKTGSTGFVKLGLWPAPPPIFFATTAIVILSRFKDATADTLALLGQPPSTRHMLQGDSWVDVPVQEMADHQRTWGTWPPPDWGLDDLPGAHFLDPTTPVTSANALNFAKASLQIDVDSVVLRLAGVDAPQLFAVTWPTSIALEANAAPTPFLVFIDQSLNGNHYDEAGLFVGGELAAPDKAYPNNFDYADMLYQQLHYAPFSNPDAFWNPGMKGVPYQVAQAGAKVVTVVPSNSFEKKFGVMNDTEQTGKILEELQAFMFLRAGVTDPPKSVGKTAMASFSSGNYYLGEWLADPANRNGNFLTNVVKAVYFLDPPLNPGKEDVDAFIASAQTWAGAGDKRIRLYMRDHSASHAKLLGKTPPGAPYVLNSPDGLRTAAEIPTKYWTAALAKVVGPIDPKWDGFGFAHHMFAAAMLTHALSQTDFS